jgi:dihydroorotase-like cyclic amidohydrolase
MQVVGRVVRTVVRGRLAYDGSQVLASPGSGQNVREE